MIILHVIISMDPATGGPPAVVSRLASGQVAAGHDAHVVSCSAPHAATAIEASLADVPRSGDVRWHTIVPAGSPRVERLLAPAARRWFRQHLGGYDVAHLHGVWDPIIKVAADTAVSRGVPYVIAPHGMLDPWSLAQSRLKKRVALALGYRRMLDCAAAIHALNDDERRLLVPLCLAARVEVLPNGVFLDELSPLPPPDAFHRDHPELGGRPYVLFLSRLHHKKGLDYLADAFARVAPIIPGVRLVVAGPDGGERQPFEQAVHRLNLADRVLITGPLYGSAKLAALSGATCFVLPSRQEGFSMAVTESLAVGTPVVISENCHFPEVAAAGAGEVVPLDAGAIADAIRRLIQDGNRRREMGEAGRRLIESSYTWPRIAERSIDIYRGLASAQPRPG